MADPDDSEGNHVREAVERSRHGAPAAGAVVRDRFSSDEIFQRILAAADEEIRVGKQELFFSGLAAGFAITITFLLYTAMTAKTGGDPVLSAILYPLGFVYIIPRRLPAIHREHAPARRARPGTARERACAAGDLGHRARGQSRRRHRRGVLPLLDGCVHAGGGGCRGGFAEKAIDTAWWTLFAKAVFAGLIVAGSSGSTTPPGTPSPGSMLVYVAFLAIPFGNLYHVVVSTTEMAFYLVFQGELALTVGVWEFVLPVLLGNSPGRRRSRHGGELLPDDRAPGRGSPQRDFKRQLSVRDALLGGFVGRSYVPIRGESEEGE